ncbi:hypothetical protein NM208_g6153 [Fusarium decemcellulare]|uniref:Uncharacterized protein n=1 Tax=Fusarium decemcellulare TaxID=57161 RepID=A0ACC1SE42_9HYPO|nr:hypothetical protein NM208_g6153 [Fusarium decemcellulare]
MTGQPTTPPDLGGTRQKSPSKSPRSRSTPSSPGGAVDPVAVRVMTSNMPQSDQNIAEPVRKMKNKVMMPTRLESSTASIASSILQYRTIQGRTFHSEKYNTEYFAPNDDQQSASMDITHHYLSLLLDNKLFLAPLKQNIQARIWAIDFADEYPNAQVIGTDLSPIQPTWIPPNVKFELEDATDTWTWPEDTFDFIHIRYLVAPSPIGTSYLRRRTVGASQVAGDDSTVDDDYALQTWNSLAVEGGKKLGRSFCIVEEGLQVPSIRSAGFVDIQEANYKVPVGSWAKDPKLQEVGQFLRSTMENDAEGYTIMLWNQVMGWPEDEYQVFLMSFRKALKNKRYHGYMKLRYVWAQKPEADQTET